MRQRVPSSGGVPPTLGEAVDKDIVVSVLKGEEGVREGEWTCSNS